LTNLTELNEVSNDEGVTAAGGRAASVRNSK
jgi:hypothetical protein